MLLLLIIPFSVMWSSLFKCLFFLILFCSFFKYLFLISKLTCFPIVFLDIFMIWSIFFPGLSLNATHSFLLLVWYDFLKKWDSSIWIFIVIKSWFWLSNDLGFFCFIFKHVFNLLDAHLASELVVNVLVLRSSFLQNFSFFLLNFDLALQLLFSWRWFIKFDWRVTFRILTHLITYARLLSLKPLVCPLNILTSFWARCILGPPFLGRRLGLWNLPACILI